jgi:hypothetical protein
VFQGLENSVERGMTMQKMISKIVALTIVISGLTFSVQAQEEGVNHCQFAKELCIRLGIDLPVTVTPTDMFSFLVQEGLYPKDGWECGKALTVGDFARVITQILESKAKTLMVENREDDQAFIDFLKAEGYSLDSVADTIATVGSLGDGSNQAIDGEANTTDPSYSRQIFGSPSEDSNGTLASFEVAVSSDGPLARVNTVSTPVSSTTVASILKKVPVVVKLPTTGNTPS